MTKKFRVWDLKNKLFKIPSSGRIEGTMFVLSKEGVLFSSVDNENFVIQTYTGRKDKNDREICEGDIVQYNRRSSYDGINFEVKWSEDNWGWVLVSKNKDYLVNERTPEGYRYEFIEIVGNIFENPELS